MLASSDHIMAAARVAALYDIHGNLPALEAVLEELRGLVIDQIVVGGDVLPGPLPRETLERLLSLDRPVRFIHGNGELAALAQFGAADPAGVSYWGTTSGEPLPEALQAVVRWSAQQLFPDYRELIKSWPAIVHTDVDGLGDVMFCHGTPRSEVECFTRLTPEHLLLPVFAAVAAPTVVCGHTHMPFDRMIGSTRVVNAGSVGMPFGAPGADWLLLGPGVELRHTAYDLTRAAERIRASRYPQAEEFATRGVLQPPTEADVLPGLTSASFY
jgi:predicted phosphodiesterase